MSSNPCNYITYAERKRNGIEEEEEEEGEIYLPRTITILNKKNTMLKLARSRLPEKQKAIYAGRQHC